MTDESTTSSAEDSVIEMIFNASVEGVGSYLGKSFAAEVEQLLTQVIGGSSISISEEIYEGIQKLINLDKDILSAITTLALESQTKTNYNNLINQLNSAIAPQQNINNWLISIKEDNSSANVANKTQKICAEYNDVSVLNTFQHAIDEIATYLMPSLNDWAVYLLSRPGGTNNFEYLTSMGTLISGVICKLNQALYYMNGDPKSQTSNSTDPSGNFATEITQVNNYLSQVQTFCDQFSLSNTKRNKFLYDIYHHENISFKTIYSENASGLTIQPIKIVKSSIGSGFKFINGNEVLVFTSTDSLFKESKTPYESTSYPNLFVAKDKENYIDLKNVPYTWVPTMVDSSESDYFCAIYKSKDFSITNPEIDFIFYTKGGFDSPHWLSVHQGSHFFGQYSHYLYASVSNDAPDYRWLFYIPQQKSSISSLNISSLYIKNADVTDGKNCLAFSGSTKDLNDQMPYLDPLNEADEGYSWDLYSHGYWLDDPYCGE